MITRGWPAAMARG